MTQTTRFLCYIKRWFSGSTLVLQGVYCNLPNIVHMALDLKKTARASSLASIGRVELCHGDTLRLHILTLSTRNWYVFQQNCRFLMWMILGGCFKHFYFSSQFGGNDPIWRSYVSSGLKPPTGILLHEFSWLFDLWRAKMQKSSIGSIVRLLKGGHFRCVFFKTKISVSFYTLEHFGRQFPNDRAFIKLRGPILSDGRSEAVEIFVDQSWTVDAFDAFGGCAEAVVPSIFPSLFFPRNYKQWIQVTP